MRQRENVQYQQRKKREARQRKENPT
jgi:hypothetical protein